jgi:hypothetical protein
MLIWVMSPRRGGEGKDRVEHKLRPSQKEAVNWMWLRERVPLDFIESEIEEEAVAPLNLQDDVKPEGAAASGNE